MTKKNSKISVNEIIGKVRESKSYQSTDSVWTLEELVSVREIFVNFETKCIQKKDGTVLYNIENDTFAELYKEYQYKKRNVKAALDNISSYCDRLRDNHSFYLEQKSRYGQQFIDNSFVLLANGLHEYHDVDDLYNYMILDNFYNKLLSDKHLVKKVG